MDPGTRLGPYEIVGSIGAGGMGVVYRARDTRLGRDVAVKTISQAVAGTPERLARFEREARLLASLNHPHIGSIYGVEDASGRLALILELVDGSTLQELVRDRAARGEPLAPAEAIAIARQIAEALDAAHQKGIVHRDLKPANVKVTPDGVVKVLDFGLGRVVGDSVDAKASQDPTLTSGGTREGTVLGTPAYMSPEQARGGAVDKRTDVWAFGCLLFELLTGAPTFDATSVPDLLVQVLTRDPDWTRLPEATPASLRRLLQRCLQKDRQRRLRDIGDALLELDEPPDPPAPVAAGVAYAPRADVSLLRLTDTAGTATSPAISPDGKMVAFVAVTGGRRQIFIRLLAGGTPLQVTRDAADHLEPRWMSDSSALVYFVPAAGSVNGSLWQVSALGGPPRRIAAATGGCDVSHDGRRLAYFRSTGDSTALVVAGLDGAGGDEILRVAREYWCDQPRFSPDDRLLAFHRAAILWDTRIDVVEAKSGSEPRPLVRAGWLRGHAWLPDGSGLVYSSSTGSTMAYPPTNNLRLVGRDGAGDRQLTFGDVSHFEPDLDASGRVVVSRMRSHSDVWAFSIDTDPAESVRGAQQVTRQSGHVQAPAVSPDGRELVYVSDNGGHSNLWLAGVDGSGVQQLTFESAPEVTVGAPIWSPNGDRIAFVRAEAARLDVCFVGREGGAIGTLLQSAFAPSWAPDGRSIYCAREGARIDRVDLATGEVVCVRSERASAPIAGPRAGELYFSEEPELAIGLGGDTAVCRAAREDGSAEVLARIARARVPLNPRLRLQCRLSPDGRWLATPLVDGHTVNVWLIPTDGGPMRAVTDFGERSVLIVRSVGWSADSTRIYAAVADANADVFLLDGLLG
jgi:eukaryotic-like serine/threonine-protein kinase